MRAKWPAGKEKDCTEQIANQMNCKDYEELGRDIRLLCPSKKWSDNQFCGKTCKKLGIPSDPNCEEGKIFQFIILSYDLILNCQHFNIDSYLDIIYLLLR